MLSSWLLPHPGPDPRGEAVGRRALGAGACTATLSGHHRGFAWTGLPGAFSSSSESTVYSLPQGRHLQILIHLFLVSIFHLCFLSSGLRGDAEEEPSGRDTDHGRCGVPFGGRRVRAPASLLRLQGSPAPHTPETSAEGTCAFAPASGWSSAATRAPRFSVAARVVGEFALRLCLFAPFHFILLLTPPSCLLLHRPLCGSRSLWMFSSVLSLRRQNSGEDLGCLLRRTCFLLPVLRRALLLMSFSPLFLSP